MKKKVILIRILVLLMILTGCGAWKISNQKTLDIDSLKEKYPYFFEVATDGGLTVYVWQMSEKSYYCHLCNTSFEALADRNFAFTDGATIEEMRMILSTYDIEREEIAIVPVVNPFSSYYYEIDDVYREKIDNMFW